MLRKSVGIFVAATVGFLLISAMGAFWALKVVRWSVPADHTAVLSPVKTKQTIKVFFGNSNLNKDMMDCSLVYPVDREVDQTPGIARAAVLELLDGPTLAESNGGYLTFLNNGIKLNYVGIVGDVARVDFDAKMDENIGGSCRVSAIRSQITQTLMQFPTIKSVVISVDGNSEEVLQP